MADEENRGKEGYRDSYGDIWGVCDCYVRGGSGEQVKVASLFPGLGGPHIVRHACHKVSAPTK